MASALCTLLGSFWIGRRVPGVCMVCVIRVFPQLVLQRNLAQWLFKWFRVCSCVHIELGFQSECCGEDMNILQSPLPLHLLLDGNIWPQKLRVRAVPGKSIKNDLSNISLLLSLSPTHLHPPLSLSLPLPHSLSSLLPSFPILPFPSPPSLVLSLPPSPSSLPHSRKIPGICWPSQQEPHWEWLPTARSRALLSLLSCQQCHHHRKTQQEDVRRNTIHRCRIWAQGLVFCWRFYSEW